MPTQEELLGMIFGEAEPQPAERDPVLDFIFNDAPEERPGFFSRFGQQTLGRVEDIANWALPKSWEVDLAAPEQLPEAQGFGEKAADFLGSAAPDVAIGLATLPLAGGIAARLGAGAIKSTFLRGLVTEGIQSLGLAPLEYGTRDPASATFATFGAPLVSAGIGAGLGKLLGRGAGAAAEAVTEVPATAAGPSMRFSSVLHEAAQEEYESITEALAKQFPDRPTRTLPLDTPQTPEGVQDFWDKVYGFQKTPPPARWTPSQGITGEGAAPPVRIPQAGEGLPGLLPAEAGPSGSMLPLGRGRKPSLRERLAARMPSEAGPSGVFPLPAGKLPRVPGVTREQAKVAGGIDEVLFTTPDGSLLGVRFPEPGKGYVGMTRVPDDVRDRGQALKLWKALEQELNARGVTQLSANVVGDPRLNQIIERFNARAARLSKKAVTPATGEIVSREFLDPEAFAAQRIAQGYADPTGTIRDLKAVGIDEQMAMRALEDEDTSAFLGKLLMDEGRMDLAAKVRSTSGIRTKNLYNTLDEVNRGASPDVAALNAATKEAARNKIIQNLILGRDTPTEVFMDLDDEAIAVASREAWQAMRNAALRKASESGLSEADALVKGMEEVGLKMPPKVVQEITEELDRMNPEQAANFMKRMQGKGLCPI